MGEVITLPNLENGAITIGDLWDAKNSRRVGFNLFGNKITTGPEASKLDELLQIDSQETSTIQFEHIKNSSAEANKLTLGAEITCELLGGMLTVTGGMKFEYGWSSGMSTEETTSLYNLPYHSVRLKDNPEETLLKSFFDGHVDKILTDDKLTSATHIVTGIEIGGRLMSSIKVTQKKTGDEFKLGFFIEKELNLFAMSAKFSANAEVGENIQITNYDAKISLTCAPPIPPPTGILDFAPPPNPPPTRILELEPSEDKESTVGKNFSAALAKQTNFLYWEGLANKPVIGIPIRFTLEPLEKIRKIENPTPIPTPNPELQINLKRFQECLSTLRDWAGEDFYKRRIIDFNDGVPRLQKILNEPTHQATIDTVGKEHELKQFVTDNRIIPLQAYLAYKQDSFDPGKDSHKQFLDMLDDLETEIETTEKSIEDFYKEIKKFCIDELNAVNVTTAPGGEEPEKPTDPNPPEHQKEDKSPLIYFTSTSEVAAWLQTQRFCKLLYSAYILQDGDTPLEGAWLPQRIFDMSYRLGKVLIQPGISYPTLTTKRNALRSKYGSDSELVSIHTPTGTLSYTRNEEARIHFVLDLLTALTGIEGENAKFSRMGHLYITYCELHGLKMNIAQTIDVIPLINLLTEMFGSLEITHTLEDTRNYITERGEEMTLIFTEDGVQSSRHVVHALLRLFQSLPNMEKGDVLCAAFEVTLYPDAPPLFLSWEGGLKSVCLDHLDLLVLLHLYQANGNEWDETNIYKYLGVDKISNFPLCSDARVEFVKSLQKTPERLVVEKLEEPADQNDLVDILTSVLTATISGPKDLANNFAKYVVYILGDVFQDNDFPYWDGEGKWSNEISDSASWGEIKFKLSTYWETKEGYQYYYALFQLFNAFQQYSAPPEVIENEDEGEDGDGEDGEGLEDGEEPVTDPTPSKQYELIYKSILEPHGTEVSENLKNQVEKIKALTSIHAKSSARLYNAVLGEEVGLVEGQCIKIQSMNLLIKLIGEIEKDAIVPANLGHEILHFTVALEIPEKVEGVPPYPPEIMYRVKTSLRLKRYYHMLSDLVENTTNLFPLPQLSTFQLEMYRITSIKDWLNLIRLIQEIAKFKRATLERIWSNIKFQYLIYENLENEFVLRSLAKGFVDKDANTVPKYIPRDIAKKILKANLSPDGNPIGFVTVWDTVAVLLKSLQVLWVLQVIPEQFQEYLLRNTVTIGGITKDALKDVEALFYWDDDEEYFNEVWDLQTIYKAIILLMAGMKESETALKKKRDFGMIEQFSRNKPEIRRIVAQEDGRAISLAQFLILRKSPENLDGSTDQILLDSLLYHLKLSKFSIVEGGINPFTLKDRVDLLTILLARAEFVLQRELVIILGSKYGSEFAQPITICHPNVDSTYFSFIDTLLLEKYKSTGLPKIITAIRIGPSIPEGKSQFLNAICTKNRDAFASKANSIGSLPQFLKGFVDYIEINEMSGNPSFLETIPKNVFYLLNLHGDALQNPEHLKFLQAITSCFLIFWSPQTWSEIEDKRESLLSLITPSHGTVSLYIDPGVDTISKIEEVEIIWTPFSSDNSINVSNAGKAFSTALLRRSKQPKGINESSPEIILPKKHVLAMNLANWIYASSMNQVKSCLILQQGRKQEITLPELDAHWTNNSFYSTLITDMVEILNDTDNYPNILSDLADLLTHKEDDMETSAWKNLSNTTVQEFGHVSFGSRGLPTRIKQQALLGHFQNDVDNNRLSVGQILIEICKLYELSPAKLPSLLVRPETIMARLFLSSHILPVPCIPNQGFFVEGWSRNFLTLCPNEPTFILNCVGTDPFVIGEVVDSIFGISFTSSSTSGWSETPWSGLSMRLIHLSQDIQTETGVSYLLLLNSKPICAPTAQGHASLIERDQQISTFLLSTSNLTLIFDFDAKFSEYSSNLSTSLIALNKVDIQDKTPRLFFVNAKVPLEVGDLSSVLSETKKTADSWIDYGDVSTLGSRVIDDAINDVGLRRNIFDLTPIKDGTQTASLVPLSDAIIDSISLLKDECPLLPDFLDNLNPSWEFIRDKIPFPYPDLDEMERSKEFKKMLDELLNLIDIAFNYHVEDFPTTIFTGMSNIVNAWAPPGIEGDVDIPTKKEMLWSNVSSMINAMFLDCKLDKDSEDDEDGKPCLDCIAKQEREELIIENWPWPETIQTQFTQLKFMRILDSYILWERWHYTNLAKELMVAFEMRLLSEEDGTYLEDPSPELEPLQWVSLDVKIVESERRLRQEMTSLFPGVDMGWDDNEDNFNFLKDIPAYEDSEKLDEAEVAVAENGLKAIPTTEIRAGGYVGIYQGGMARRVMAMVENKVLKELENSSGKKISNSFRQKVVSHTIWRLGQLNNKAEGHWKKDHDPLKIYLTSTKSSII